MCCFYREHETFNHIFFQCSELKEIWKQVLLWLKTDPLVVGMKKLSGFMLIVKAMGGETSILKCVYAETIYEIWNYRNQICFDKTISNNSI